MSSLLPSFMSMFEHDVRASALPLIHPAEERSPRPRIQWNSVSLSETMQQDATKGRYCFSQGRGRFCSRERDQLKVCNTRCTRTSRHLMYSGRMWLKALKKTTNNNPVDPPAHSRACKHPAALCVKRCTRWIMISLPLFPPLSHDYERCGCVFSCGAVMNDDFARLCGGDVVHQIINNSFNRGSLV